MLILKAEREMIMKNMHQKTVIVLIAVLFSGVFLIGNDDAWTRGCTRTIGYWKTHSEFGPAPFDATWALKGGAAAFFDDGLTYYTVLWTAPRGNAYYILAHQYIAAELNMLSGASSGDQEMVDAMDWASSYFFAAYKPSDSISKIDRLLAIAAATVLDNYNNGLTGPGHCSE